MASMAVRVEAPPAPAPAFAYRDRALDFYATHISPVLDDMEKYFVRGVAIFEDGRTQYASRQLVSSVAMRCRMLGDPRIIGSAGDAAALIYASREVAELRHALEAIGAVSSYGGFTRLWYLLANYETVMREGRRSAFQ